MKVSVVPRKLLTIRPGAVTTDVELVRPLAMRLSGTISAISSTLPTPFCGVQTKVRVMHHRLARRGSPGAYAGCLTKKMIRSTGPASAWSAVAFTGMCRVSPLSSKTSPCSCIAAICGTIDIDQHDIRDRLRQGAHRTASPSRPSQRHRFSCSASNGPKFRNDVAGQQLDGVAAPPAHPCRRVPSAAG